MLHEFLAANRLTLIDICRIKVAQRLTPKPSDAELEHGIPHFLDQLIRTLRAEQTSDPMASRKISGPAGGGKPFFSEIGESATQHGRELLQHGFTVDQVVHDYGDLCQAITDVASELGEPIHIDEFRTLNRCLDNAIADAVTEFAQQHDALVAEHAVQCLNERLASLAHELRNHIQTATLAFGAIKSGNVGLTGATGSVLERSLIALRSLVDKSLADARVTAGMPARRELISLAEFIQQIRVSAMLEARACECTFTVSDVDPTLAVDADRDLLSSAVGNLLQNAFKFTGHRTEVALHAYAAADRILIEVEDHCGGLPPGLAENMFTPFSQGGSNKSGLGLGLAIAQRGVEAIDGILRVRDVPRSGCVFTIDLPRHAVGVRDRQLEALPKEDRRSAASQARMPRVLIVDDSDSRFLIASILARDGYDTAVCAEGDEALKLQAGSPFDVLITDIFMPQKDGLETIRAFRKGFPQTRIIAMSGGLVNRVEYLQLSLELGADRVLKKPFDRAELNAALMEVLPPAARVTA